MLRRIATILLALLLIVGIAGYILLVWPLHDPHPPLRLGTETLAILDATLYPSPDQPPIAHATVVIRDGRIVSVGRVGPVPPGARLLPCHACIVTAGFWNAHIHFTERKWAGAAFLPAAKLNTQLADMLTSRGFTTVVDLGSDPRDTLSLRRRIETGDLFGPKIYTAAAAQYPPNGIPFYLRESLPPLLLKVMPQPATPGEAAKVEERNIAAGADLLKLFTGSYVERGVVLPMPVANAAAAVRVAHAHGQLAFAHESNLPGALVARDAGVDVLAHAADTVEGVTPAILQSFIDRHMAMVPTLKMFATTVTSNPNYLNPIYDQVGQFHRLGGELLFGTDVGYMKDYTTEDEFRALARSGLTAKDILRMLTSAPAERFGVANEKGRVAPGQLADLVVLGSDPAKDVAAFSDVLFTIRSGRLIYERPGTVFPR